MVPAGAEADSAPPTPTPTQSPIDARSSSPSPEEPPASASKPINRGRAGGIFKYIVRLQKKKLFYSFTVCCIIDLIQGKLSFQYAQRSKPIHKVYPLTYIEKLTMRKQTVLLVTMTPALSSCFRSTGRKESNLTLQAPATRPSFGQTLQFKSEDQRDQFCAIINNYLFDLRRQNGLTNPGDEAQVGKTPPKQSPNVLREKTIFYTHPEYELTYDMMLGIRQTVAETETKPLANITKAQFKAETRLMFPSQGSEITPSHNMDDFFFKDYAPDVFRHLRHRFGVSAEEYLACVCGDFQYIEFISNSKSGQFFFYTYDNRYMIKTISRPEAMLFQRVLPSYYKHMMSQQDSMLTRVYGMHKVRPHNQREAVRFVIMGSVFYTPSGAGTSSPTAPVPRPCVMHRIFDLKGSITGRNASADDKRNPSSCVYKDNDLLDQGIKVKIGESNAKRFLRQIHSDVEFMRGHRIMDYSLLLGLHQPKQHQHCCERLHDHTQPEPEASPNSEDDTEVEQCKSAGRRSPSPQHKKHSTKSRGHSEVSDMSDSDSDRVLELYEDENESNHDFAFVDRDDGDSDGVVSSVNSSEYTSEEEQGEEMLTSGAEAGGRTEDSESKSKFKIGALKHKELVGDAQWIADAHSSRCMLCQTGFTLVNRRHHCRLCGRLVCAKCSKFKFKAPGIDKEVRMCSQCNVAKTPGLGPSINSGEGSSHHAGSGGRGRRKKRKNKHRRKKKQVGLPPSIPESGDAGDMPTKTFTLPESSVGSTALPLVSDFSSSDEEPEEVVLATDTDTDAATSPKAREWEGWEAPDTRKTTPSTFYISSQKNKTHLFTSTVPASCPKLPPSRPPPPRPQNRAHTVGGTRPPQTKTCASLPRSISALETGTLPHPPAPLRRAPLRPPSRAPPKLPTDTNEVDPSLTTTDTLVEESEKPVSELDTDNHDTVDHDTVDPDSEPPVLPPQDEEEERVKAEERDEKGGTQTVTPDEVISTHREKRRRHLPYLKEDIRRMRFVEVDDDGLPTIRRAESHFMQHNGGFCVDGTVYYFGIIDILIVWDFKKKVETFGKTKVLNYEPLKISSVEPDQYAERFKKFLAGHVR